MNSTTKKMGLIALVYSITLSVVYGFSLYIVQKQSIELAQLRDTTAEQVTKEQAYNSLLLQLENTAEERSELMSRFLSIQDTVSFISAVEQMAQQWGLRLETTNLAITEGKDDELDLLLASFKVSGQEMMVKQFTVLLESLPYHKRVSELSVYQQADENDWQGDITLYFTLLP